MELAGYSCAVAIAKVGQFIVLNEFKYIFYFIQVLSFRHATKCKCFSVLWTG